jgi:hypothetical protein
MRKNYRRNGTGIVFPKFRTQYIPDFFVAEHYDVRNTTSWGSKDLALEKF